MTETSGQIVYFGDSLTDDGNLLDFANMVLAPGATDGLGGPTGAASDGPTHATYTTDLLGVPAQNYAVASAEVVGVQDLAFVAENFGLDDALIVPPDSPLLDIDINLNGQVGRFIAENAGSDLSDTTAFILIGANDYNEVDLSSPTVVQDLLGMMNDIVTGIAEEAIRLYHAGVGTIQISTLPATEFYAASAELSDGDLALANAVFSTHNLALANTVQLLQDAGVPAELFDITAITDALTEDPTGFGFIAPLGTMLWDPALTGDFDADQIFSVDDLHPTTAAHGVIGAHHAHVFDGGTNTKLTDRANIYQALESDDFIAALGGSDIVRAGLGDDIVLGGSGFDTLFGQEGSDLISAGSDSDLVHGNQGADIIGGGEGADLLLAGKDDDLIVDGLGSDISRGGLGDDTFIFTEAELIGGTTGDQDLYIGGQGFDQLIIVLSAANYAAYATALEGASPNAALTSLGIATGGIESIIAVETRAGLDAFSGASWYELADLWGLI